MLDFAALDVALGLIFVYLVLSLVCSAVNETVASIFAWRADTLREGLENILEGRFVSAKEQRTRARAGARDPATREKTEREKLYEHPLVKGLIRSKRSALSRVPGITRVPIVSRIPAVNDERYPSYLPAGVVVTALLNPADGQTLPTAQSVDAASAGLPNGPIRHAAQIFWNEARERGGRLDEQVTDFRRSVETWYDEAMSRVSGWYRRRVQVWLWIWGASIVALLHADTIEIARTLWTDEAKRDAIAARAEQIATSAPASEDATAYLDELENLGVPLGWADGWPNWADTWGERLWVVGVNALGLGMTAVALTLGAPFWFDLLKKVANVRAAGRSPAERPVEKAAEAGEPSATARGEASSSPARGRARTS